MRIVSNFLKTEHNFDLRNEEKKQTEYIQSTVKNLKIWQIRKYQEWINIQNELSKGPKDQKTFKDLVLFWKNMFEIH